MSVIGGIEPWSQRTELTELELKEPESVEPQMRLELGLKLAESELELLSVGSEAKKAELDLILFVKKLSENT